MSSTDRTAASDDRDAVTGVGVIVESTDGCTADVLLLISVKEHVVADGSSQTPSSHKGVADTPAASIKKYEKTMHRLFGHPIHDQKKKQSAATSNDNTTRSKKKAKKPHWWTKNRCKVAPAPKEPSEKKQCDSEPKKEERGRKVEEDAASTTKNRGLPNPAQICYMNSCLQSLLTLQDFVTSISCQEPVWDLHHDAAIMRSFLAIHRSHFSSDSHRKICLLIAFKAIVAEGNSEFQDLNQKDAHEFLISVLAQMSSVADSMGRTMSCPVNDHMVFKMQITRTCKSCGSRSIMEEEFTHLSLDMVPGGGTVEDMLQNNLKETELDFNCNCGGILSGRRSSFVNLPRVLVLHLKRFRFLSTKIEKICDPVILLRDLVVSSNQDGACYSLVSTISHIGHSINSGHYICDGVDVEVGPEDLTDRWFTYNDSMVTETTGDFVCDQRQEEAYILFYQKMEAKT